MKASQILYKVAELIGKSIEGDIEGFEGKAICRWGACELIERVYGDRHIKAKERAQDLHRKLFKQPKPFWYGLPFADWGTDTVNVDNQNHRLLSILMVATIAEDMGD